MENQKIEFTPEELRIVENVLGLVTDRLAHFRDGEMGWDEAEVDAFWDVNDKFESAAKAAGWWWAR